MPARLPVDHASESVVRGTELTRWVRDFEAAFSCLASLVQVSSQIAVSYSLLLQVGGLADAETAAQVSADMRRKLCVKQI